MADVKAILRDDSPRVYGEFVFDYFFFLLLPESLDCVVGGFLLDPILELLRRNSRVDTGVAMTETYAHARIIRK